jgi:hypothetical protein
VVVVVVRGVGVGVAPSLFGRGHQPNRNWQRHT